MIQRIQSFYLILTSLLSVLFLSGKMFILNGEAGQDIYATISGIKRMSESGPDLTGNILPLVIIMIAVASIAFITIFLYKKRKLQTKFSLFLIVMSVIMILAIAYYIFKYTTGYNAELRISISLILPLLILLCSILAYRGIRKDDELVKSYDRLR
jgi:hypothetical protein